MAELALVILVIDMDHASLAGGAPREPEASLTAEWLFLLILVAEFQVLSLVAGRQAELNLTRLSVCVVWLFAEVRVAILHQCFVSDIYDYALLLTIC